MVFGVKEKKVKKFYLFCLVLLGLSGCGGDKGAFIEEVECENDQLTAIKKLKSIIEDKGMTLFAIIDHASNAKNAKMHLKPNTVVIFGNPVVGTSLMECNPSMGMDLPLKMLFTTDYTGHATISYTNPEYWSLKHNIKDKNCLKIINNLAIGMKELAQEVGKK